MNSFRVKNPLFGFLWNVFRFFISQFDKLLQNIQKKRGLVSQLLVPFILTMAGNGFVISRPSFAESCYVSFAPKQTRSSCLSLAVADFFGLEWLLFPNVFFATLQPNAPHLIKQDYLGYILAWNEKTTFAFDEGERMLVVPFLRKSLLKALWSSPKGIDRDAMRFQALDAILGCLTSYVAQIASISCANVFLAALSWRHRFFCAISTIQKLFVQIERTLLTFDFEINYKFLDEHKNPIAFATTRKRENPLSTAQKVASKSSTKQDEEAENEEVSGSIVTYTEEEHFQ